MKILHLSVIVIFYTTIAVSSNVAFADDTNSDHWHTFYIVGKFTNSNPPKPDQTYIAQYRITNATLQSISGDYSGIIVNAYTSDNGLLEVKFPRNFPYHNQNPSPDDFFIMINGYGSSSYYHPQSPMTEDARKKLINTVTRPPPYPESYSVKDDCYYLFSIPFYTSARIEIHYGLNGLISDPYHGDDVPQYCNLKTNVSYMSPLVQANAGVSAQDVKCTSNLQLVFKAGDGSPACVKPNTAQKLIERGWAKSLAGASALEEPSIGLYNVTASLQPIILGMSFFVNVEVTNNQNTPITYYGGCASPLSVSFDNIQTYTDGFHCLAISKYILQPHDQVLVHSDKINTAYNATGPDYANAEIKFTYENNGTSTSWFTSAEFPIQRAIKLNCTEPFGSQMEKIDKSVNVQKAIALAYSSPEFLSKVKQYGNVSYMSFYNDLFPAQSCDSYWKGVEVMFTASDGNGARNIRVSEDITLTKVLNVEDFQVVAN